MPLIRRLKALSVYKLMLLVAIMVALLPISILAFHLYHSAWDNSWREIEEKHQLLAQNLAMPLATSTSSWSVMVLSPAAVQSGSPLSL